MTQLIQFIWSHYKISLGTCARGCAVALRAAVTAIRTLLAGQVLRYFLVCSRRHPANSKFNWEDTNAERRQESRVGKSWTSLVPADPK